MLHRKRDQCIRVIDWKKIKKSQRFANCRVSVQNVGDTPVDAENADSCGKLNHETRVSLDWIDFYRRCQNVAAPAVISGSAVRSSIAKSGSMIPRIYRFSVVRTALIAVVSPLVRQLWRSASWSCVASVCARVRTTTQWSAASRRALRSRPHAVRKPRQYTVS